MNKLRCSSRLERLRKIINKMNIIKQFFNGLVNSLLIPNALIEVVKDKRLRELTIKSTVLNGIVYLGSVLVYQYLICMIFVQTDR